MISAITEGGGFHLPDEIEGVGEGAGVKVVRPLRDISTKEAGVYLHWNDVPIIPHFHSESELQRQGQGSKGIRDLTKGSFVVYGYGRLKR